MFDRGTATDPRTATADPGPLAARVASWMLELAEVDRDLTDAEQIDLIRGLEDLKAGAAAAQARITTDLDAARQDQRAREGVPAERRSAGIASEVALARRVSPVRGGQHLGLAKALVHEMPHALCALTTGALSEWRATLLVRESACLTRADRITFDAELCRDPSTLQGWGDQRLIAEAKKIAYRLDAQSVVRRNRKAESERHVSVRPAPDTMSYLTGLLPVPQGIAVYAALSRRADEARASGDTRSRGQIMADTLVERVTGQTRACDVRIEIQLVMTDRTLLGGDDEPGYLPGYGTVPAEWIRDLLTGGDEDGSDPSTEIWLRRLYTSPSGSELVSMDSKARRAPAGLARFVTARDRTCRTPWCDAPIRHIDHVQSHADGGETTADNLQGLCEACNYAKQAPGWRASPTTAPDGRHQVASTTPSGHTYRSTAPPPPGVDPPDQMNLDDLLLRDLAEHGPGPGGRWTPIPGRPFDSAVFEGELAGLELALARILTPVG
ncbi:HNH endonuclease [Occultella kanbiaonis]|uniref:HNH endonuclease n=1 Tax=Occultella kanbiaonis TaxID=2675754 RepID=UPI001F38C6B9|nr:HNH endonuclease signature motif containing protein [Occultella kanbiaonis]